jgi:predicted glycoside hydrolase/deacetylase ChbG (UPF0249 family)
MPTPRRALIVNADDFGQTTGINRGVIRAHERGIVTSASLMVRWPSAAAAAAYGRAHPALSLGLHVDLGEWVCRDGRWEALYEVVSMDDAAAVAKEIASQLTAFRRLVGRHPTHLDSHQHVHREEPVRSAMVKLARQLGVPLRACHPHIRYCGGFYGQTDDGRPIPGVLSLKGLTTIVSSLRSGVTELGCHPGEGRRFGKQSMYQRERAREVRVLCHPRLRRRLAELGTQLCSFHDAARLLAAGRHGRLRER